MIIKKEKGELRGESPLEIDIRLSRRLGVAMTCQIRKIICTTTD
jgi:hypothetical protein